MRPSAWQNADDDTHYIDADDDGDEELIAGERVCPPSGSERNVLARVYLALGIAGVACLVATLPMPPRLVAAAQSFFAALSRTDVASTEWQPTPLPSPPAAPMQEQSVADAPPVKGDAPRSAADVDTPASANSTATSADDDNASATSLENEKAAAPDQTDDASPPAPLPPPKVDPADRYQVKALAAGLNPNLSRALLARLSADDYRNAGRAVQAALATASNDEVVLMPKERKAKLAQFEVHFVRSAAPECRRYIVKVAKDGWATTAAPMEKCGFKSERS